MIKDTTLIILGFGGGVTVGTAMAGFITVLKIIPRLVEVTDVKDKIRWYQVVVSLGIIISTIIYFSDFTIKISNLILAIICLSYGTFIGLLSSALAEVLNVIPILSKKLKIKKDLKIVAIALMLGKILGTLYFWIFHQ